MIGWGEDGQVTIRQSLFHLLSPSKVSEREWETEREIIPPDTVTPTGSATPELE